MRGCRDTTSPRRCRGVTSPRRCRGATSPRWYREDGSSPALHPDHTANSADQARACRRLRSTKLGHVARRHVQPTVEVSASRPLPPALVSTWHLDQRHCRPGRRAGSQRSSDRDEVVARAASKDRARIRRVERDAERCHTGGVRPCQGSVGLPHEQWVRATAVQHLELVCSRNDVAGSAALCPHLLLVHVGRLVTFGPDG